MRTRGTRLNERQLGRLGQDEGSVVGSTFSVIPGAESLL